ncbi:MAG: TonB-dependent receptor, partial [Myxococcota bacterium]
MIGLLLGLPAFGEPDAEIEVVARPEPGPTVVRVDEVAQPADGVEDVLVTVPGVRVRRLGGLGAFAGVSLRGTGFRQTLVRLDGVPLNPDGVAAVDLSRFPLAGIETLRVTSGRPAATVGAAPIGGVVDLQTASTPRFASAEVAVGSFRSVRGSAAVGQTTRGGVEGTLALDGFATGGGFSYLDDGGTRFVTEDDRFVDRQNNDRRQLSGLGRLRLGDGRLTVLATGATREEGLPGSIGIPLDGVRFATSRGLVAVEGRQTTAVSDRRLQLWGLLRREQLRDPQGALGRIDAGQRDRFDVFGGKVAGQRQLGRVTLRGSVAARHEAFARRQDQGGVTRARRWGASASVDAPVALGPLTWTPGLDLRALLSRLPDQGEVGAVLPGMTAVLFGDRAVSAWLSATAGFRPPDLTELYGDRGTLVGNPDLRPERATKAELGLRAAGRGKVTLGFDGAVSVTAIRDAIGWLQNNQRTLVA